MDSAEWFQAFFEEKKQILEGSVGDLKNREFEAIELDTGFLYDNSSNNGEVVEFMKYEVENQ